MEVFVDNLFILLQEDQQILKAADQICEIFAGAAFPLHEIVSNDNFSNETLKSRELSPDSPVLKTLGLWWDTRGDNWLINKPDFRVKEPTKRSLLSDLAKVFDPLGFFFYSYHSR